MSPTSPTAATQTFSATIKNKYMSTMRSKKNVPKISDRQRLGTRKAQYVGMVILACVQMVGSKLSSLSFFHLVNFSERLEQAMVIQATWKKTKGSRTYDGPDALPLSHGRLVGATQTVGSYNKLLQPVATETFFRLKWTVRYYWSCACDPLPPPPCPSC